MVVMTRGQILFTTITICDKLYLLLLNIHFSNCAFFITNEDNLSPIYAASTKDEYKTFIFIQDIYKSIYIGFEGLVVI